MGRRLVAEAAPTHALLVITVLLGLFLTGTVLAQASLPATVLATAGAGGRQARRAWRAAFAVLLMVVLVPAAAAHGGEAAALGAAADVEERLRARLVRHTSMLGPAWLGKQRAGEVTILATAGLDSLDP